MFATNSAASSPLQPISPSPPPATGPLPQAPQVPPPPPRSGWVIRYPVAGLHPLPTGAADTSSAFADPAAALNLQVAADINRHEEPLMEGLATIGATMIGQSLFADLAHRLGGRPIAITRAHGPRQAGLTADAQGALHLAICPDTMLAQGMKMQAHSGAPPFSWQKRYACGLFDFLLSAMNYFENGTFEPGRRIDLHQRTVAFRQAMLDARHQPAAIAAADAPNPAGAQAVGLRVNLNDSMPPYKDGFHRMLTTLRDSEAGNRMLRGFAQSIATQALEVYHVDHPGDAGLFLGHNGIVCWYYHVGSLAAHAALLQTTEDDLPHEQRDACAAFDLLFRSWESLDLGRSTGTLQAGDRLDLDYARRSFRNELIDGTRVQAGPARIDAAAGLRV